MLDLKFTRSFFTFLSPSRLCVVMLGFISKAYPNLLGKKSLIMLLYLNKVANKTRPHINWYATPRSYCTLGLIYISRYKVLPFASIVFANKFSLPKCLILGNNRRTFLDSILELAVVEVVHQIVNLIKQLLEASVRTGPCTGGKKGH
jgi:hypothetical protein